MTKVLGLTTSLILACACSSGGAASSSDQSDTESTNAADTHCQVVLRYAGQSTIAGGEVFLDPSTHKNWVRYRAVADIDSKLLQTGGVAKLRYRSVLSGSKFGGTFPGPWTDVPAINPQDNPNDPALANPGAGLEGIHGGQVVPKGFTRVAFATTINTIEAGNDGEPTMQMIPFVVPGGAANTGTTLWDHNRVSDPNGSYNLDPPHHFVVTDDFTTCPAPGGA
jgi:hypothetical protein